MAFLFNLDSYSTNNVYAAERYQWLQSECFNQTPDDLKSQWVLAVTETHLSDMMSLMFRPLGLCDFSEQWNLKNVHVSSVKSSFFNWSKENCDLGPYVWSLRYLSCKCCFKGSGDDFRKKKTLDGTPGRQEFRNKYFLFLFVFSWKLLMLKMDTKALH